MIKYLIGWFKNLFNPAVSFFAFIDNCSKVSANAKVWRKVKVYNSKIGEYSYVGPNTSIVCANIGKFCSIASGNAIGLGSHPLSYLSTSPIFYSEKNASGHSWTKKNHFSEFKRITIGNDVWIGSNVIILGGVNIGDGVVIGAGSVVTKDLPPYSIAVGVPAKVLKYRFNKEIISKILYIKWWNFDREKLIKYIHIFQKDNLSIVDIEKFISENKREESTM